MSEIDDYSIPCYLRSHGVDSYARQVEDMYAEIARLQADNDELDEQCTKRILEIYKLRAEREELVEALERLVSERRQGLASLEAWVQARAALAKVKGE
ncbi:MAG: hypothetical protein C0436_00210 [Alphaproteobacteria bacterium]|nr:hypothetical protein [Alphaproteobacteria bacterium]